MVLPVDRSNTFDKEKYPLLRLMNALSFDVVAGSILCAAFAVEITGLEAPTFFYLILGLSVWLIYTADHFLDALRLREKCTIYRHWFHYRYRKAILTAMAIATILNIFLIFIFLEPAVRFNGFLLLALAGVYFSSNKFFKIQQWIPKEIFVAVIYTGGIWLLPITANNFVFSFKVWQLFYLFLAQVLSGVLLLSYFEYNEDLEDDHRTIAVNHGTKPVVFLIILFCALSAGFSAYFVFFENHPVIQFSGIILLVMSSCHLAILFFERNLKKDHRYRYLLELVFWIPGLLLLLS